MSQSEKPDKKTLADLGGMVATPESAEAPPDAPNAPPVIDVDKMFADVSTADEVRAASDENAEASAFMDVLVAKVPEMVARIAKPFFAAYEKTDIPHTVLPEFRKIEDALFKFLAGELPGIALTEVQKLHLSEPIRREFLVTGAWMCSRRSVFGAQLITIAQQCKFIRESTDEDDREKVAHFGDQHVVAAQPEYQPILDVLSDAWNKKVRRAENQEFWGQVDALRRTFAKMPDQLRASEVKAGKTGHFLCFAPRKTWFDKKAEARRSRATAIFMGCSNGETFELEDVVSSSPEFQDMCSELFAVTGGGGERPARTLPVKMIGQFRFPPDMLRGCDPELRNHLLRMLKLTTDGFANELELENEEEAIEELREGTVDPWAWYRARKAGSMVHTVKRWTERAPDSRGEQKIPRFTILVKRAEDDVLNGPDGSTFGAITLERIVPESNMSIVRFPFEALKAQIGVTYPVTGNGFEGVPGPLQRILKSAFSELARHQPREGEQHETASADGEAVAAAPAEGASSTAASFPIEDFDDLKVSDIESKLEGLGFPELETVRQYELEHKNRTGVLNAIKKQLSAE